MLLFWVFGFLGLFWWLWIYILFCLVTNVLSCYIPAFVVLYSTFRHPTFLSKFVFKPVHQQIFHWFFYMTITPWWYHFRPHLIFPLDAIFVSSFCFSLWSTYLTCSIFSSFPKFPSYFPGVCYPVLYPFFFRWGCPFDVHC